MSTVMVKATPVNGLVAFVRQDLDAVQQQAVLSQLSPEEAAIFTGRLIASDKVGLEQVDRYTHLAAAAKNEPVFEFARRAGCFGAEQGTRTVYKFILALMKPESVLRAAPMMWQRVYDSGRLVSEVGVRQGRVVVQGFPSNRAVCGRITGWFEFIARKSASSATTAHHCRSDGASECSWEFHW